MQAAATTWLTIIGVLWHAMVGCCAHHAHAADQHLPAAVVESHDEVDLHHRHEAGSSHDCRGHYHADDEPSADVDTDDLSEHGDQPAHEPCDETACSFLGANPTTAIENAGLVSTGAWLPAATAMEAASGHRRGGLVQPFKDRPPPLRTHLALNVLLI